MNLKNYGSSDMILCVLYQDHSDHAMVKLDGRNSFEEMDLVRRLHGKKTVFFVVVVIIRHIGYREDII